MSSRKVKNYKIGKIDPIDTDHGVTELTCMDEGQHGGANGQVSPADDMWSG